MKKIELKKDKKVIANNQKKFKSILPDELSKIKGGNADASNAETAWLKLHQEWK